MPKLQIDNTPDIDPESIYEFLLDVWCEHTPHDDQFYAFIGWKDNRGWHQCDIRSGKTYLVPLLIRKHWEADLYFCPNLFSKPERKRACALPSKWAWCDIDEGDHTLFPPSVLWETSPGRRQGLWLRAKEREALEAERYSRAIAGVCSSDGTGWEFVKMLRIPGTWNYKRPRPHKVRLICADWDTPIVRSPVIIDQLKKDDERTARRVPEQQRSNNPPPVDFDDCRIRYVPTHVRQHLTKTINGDRSRTYWRVAKEAHERGASDAQIECLVRGSYAFKDKFAGRSNAADVEIERILSKLETDLCPNR